MAIRPPEIIDDSYIQIRDLKSTNNAFTAGGKFSAEPYDYYFPAYVTSFSDEYTSNFNQQSVYGRMDPIATFQNTQRVISLSFVCPSANGDDAHYYLSAVSALIRSMYPNYHTVGTRSAKSSIISAPPMFAIRFGNLIQGSYAGNNMLKGVISALSFNPVLEEGMFIVSENSSGSTRTAYYPKNIEINLTFNPLHDFELGFNDRGKVERDFEGFPYITKAGSPVSAGGRSLSAETLVQEVEGFMTAASAADLPGVENEETQMSEYDQSVTDTILS